MSLISLFLPSVFVRAEVPESQSEYAASYGRFRPTYFFLFHRPRTADQAQNLYNHIRTTAWYLDAISYLTHDVLPFRNGIDDAISSTPVYSDFIGLCLAFYQLFLCWLLGIPIALLARMIINVLIDFVLCSALLLADILDALLKANLRNLAILEDWLLKGSHGYAIEITPNDEFLPRARSGRRSASGYDSKDKYRNKSRARLWRSRLNYHHSDLELEELD